MTAPAVLFLTLDQAKAHLRIPVVANDPGDGDLAWKVASAEATILDYVSVSPAGRARVADWTSAVPPTAPTFVVAAMLLQLGELWRFRGDDLETPARDASQVLAAPIVSLLRRVADPVIA